MYPSNQQYKDSVNSGLYFENKDFKQHLYSAIKVNSGELVYETGQNATVFKVKDNGGNIKALKLFFKEDHERSSRYTLIGEYLKQLNSPYFIHFEYRENLIYVENVNSDDKENYFPGVVMDWVEGVTLEGKVKELTLRNDTKALKILADNFLELSHFLLASDFAHGDLKHDNIIVSNNLDLKLIDYDGLYVPQLKGQHSFELGTKSFQHPKRRKVDFNEHIDDFSILTLYVSLLTFSKFPSYYLRFSDQQNLFFREEDFLDKVNSEIFNLLSLDSELKPFAVSILISLNRDNIYIHDLVQILNRNFPRAKLLKEIQKTFDFYQDEDKVITLETENCNEVQVMLNGVTHNRFYFDKFQDTLYINIEDEKLTELTLVLRNDFGDNTIQSRVNVQPRSEVIYFKCNDTSHKEGSEIVFMYNLKNVKYAEIKNEQDESFSRILTTEIGKISFNIHHSAVYYLKIIDFLDRVTFTNHTSLEIVYPIEIRSFDSNYHHVFEGIPIELSWDVTNADKITLSTDRLEKEDVSGLKRVSSTPVRNVSYTLECSNRFYTQKSAHRVNIHVQPNPHKLSLNNLTPNLKELNFDYELDKIDLGDFDLQLPNMNINLNLDITLDKEGDIHIHSVNKKSIKDQLINLLKFK